MTVRWTVRATEPTAVFSPQRKYKTVGSSPASATKMNRDTQAGVPVHSKPTPPPVIAGGGVFVDFWRINAYTVSKCGEWY